MEMETLREFLIRYDWGEVVASEASQEYLEGGIEAVDDYACGPELVNAVECWEEEMKDLVELKKRT